MDYGLIRQDVKDSLKLYAEQGIPTGGFLRAVLENDLFRAMGKADHMNQRVLFEICGFIYNELPHTCWGSPEKVDAHLASFQRGE